jgi:hypothetical protein
MQLLFKLRRRLCLSVPMNNNYWRKLYDVKGTRIGVFVIDNTYHLIPHVVIYDFRELIIIDCLFSYCQRSFTIQIDIKGLNNIVDMASRGIGVLILIRIKWGMEKIALPFHVSHFEKKTFL